MTNTSLMTMSMFCLACGVICHSRSRISIRALRYASDGERTYTAGRAKLPSINCPQNITSWLESDLRMGTKWPLETITIGADWAKDDATWSRIEKSSNLITPHTMLVCIVKLKILTKMLEWILENREYSNKSYENEPRTFVGSIHRAKDMHSGMCFSYVLLRKSSS